MLTALSISSMHISTVIMLRRTITPIRPTAKSVPESMRYCAVLGTHGLLNLFLGISPIEDVLRRRFLFLGRQFALTDHDRTDHGHEQEQRSHFERHQVVGVQRHPHRLGVPILTVTRAAHQL